MNIYCTFYSTSIAYRFISPIDIQSIDWVSIDLAIKKFDWLCLAFFKTLEIFSNILPIWSSMMKTNGPFIHKICICTRKLAVFIPFLSLYASIHFLNYSSPSSMYASFSSYSWGNNICFSCQINSSICYPFELINHYFSWLPLIIFQGVYHTVYQKFFLVARQGYRFGI